MPTFEDLLAGRELHTLSDADIKALIKELSPEELDRANDVVRRSRRAPSPSKQTINAKTKREETVKALLLKGLT